MTLAISSLKTHSLRVAIACSTLSCPPHPWRDGGSSLPPVTWSITDHNCTFGHHNTCHQLCSYCVHWSALHTTLEHCTALYCTALHYIALHCTILYCTAVSATSCNILHSSALYCTVLHWIELMWTRKSLFQPLCYVKLWTYAEMFNFINNTTK